MFRPPNSPRPQPGFRPSHPAGFDPAGPVPACGDLPPLVPAGAAGPPRGQNGDGVIQHAQQPGAIFQLPVKRRHGAVQPLGLILEPHLHHAREQESQPPRPRLSRKTGAVHARRRHHPALRAFRKAEQAQRQRRIMPRGPGQGAHRILVGLQRIQPAHQHLEQALPRPLAGKTLIIRPALGQNLPVRLPEKGREKFIDGAESPPQFRQGNAGSARNIRQRDAVGRRVGQFDEEAAQTGVVQGVCCHLILHAQNGPALTHPSFGGGPALRSRPRLRLRASQACVCGNNIAIAPAPLHLIESGIGLLGDARQAQGPLAPP